MSHRELFIRCDCNTPEHMIVFDTYEWDAEPNELCVAMQLAREVPFWRRLLLAAQYAITGKSNPHWWPETVIKRTDAIALRKYLDAYLNEDAS